MNRHVVARWRAVHAWAAVAALACVASGCGPEQTDPTGGRKVIDIRPTTEVRKVVVEADMALTDSDGDGVPDTVLVRCLLFPALMDTTQSLVGKGSFRLEVYDFTGGLPPEGRAPLAQVNFNYEESRQYLGPWRSIRGLPAYHFPLKVGPLSAEVQRLRVVGRFFPEGRAINGPEDEPECGSTEIPVAGRTTQVTNRTITPRPPASLPESGRLLPPLRRPPNP